MSRYHDWTWDRALRPLRNRMQREVDACVSSILDRIEDQMWFRVLIPIRIQIQGRVGRELMK